MPGTKKPDQPEVIESETDGFKSDKIKNDGFKNEELKSGEQSSAPASFLSGVSDFGMVLITGFGLALLVIIVMLASSTTPVQVSAQTESAVPRIPATMSQPVPAQSGDVVGDGVIERKGEGRHFYTTIKIPPGAETLYLSGSGARQQADGTWGDMEQQTIDTFNRFRETLEAEGWSLSDIVQVRAFAVAGEYGLLDFDGFNRGYRQFFGSEDNPMKPVRSFVEIAGLVVPGWLVEIEIRAARVP